MEMLLDWIVGGCLIVGGFFVFIGGVGAIRMPDLYTRMHATSLTDTLGCTLILVGLMIEAGFGLVSLKLAAVLVFLLFTSPTSAYALANAASVAGHKPLLAGDDGLTTEEPSS